MIFQDLKIYGVSSLIGLDFYGTIATGKRIRTSQALVGMETVHSYLTKNESIMSDFFSRN